jgi:predicted ATPase/DNA-binding CsgD family transcriptional regulator
MEARAKRGLQAIGDRHPNNLPRHLSSFVGRGSEISRLKSLLARSRMVTLTGPGGAGKSRLAAELGSASLDRWQDAVWWVDLAPVVDPGQVASAVVSALELQGRGPAQEVAIAWLATRRALLVLDNCEHLLTASADFCQMALERGPQLTVLATSREALGVPGEAQWPVFSLRTPDAVRLFEARAALVRPDFKVAAQNADVVTEICERIDRLPLAIEMAAARMGIMSEKEILSQLTDRFRLLIAGSRTAPERQRTMSRTIDWSYRLLTEQEALLLRRLSVFRGGFDFESIEAVCGDGVGGKVLEILAGLVQKSMVVADVTVVSGTRYRLLESQLVYAEDRLRQAGESELMRRRHHEYFLNCLIAKTRNPGLAHPPPGLAEAKWIVRESGNLWAAMGWAQNHADDMGLALAAYMPYVPFGDVTQLRSTLEDLLDRSPEKGVSRVYALRSAAALAVWQGDNEAAVRAADAAVALARELGDLEVLAYALTVAAVAHAVHGELDGPIEMYEEANRHLRGSGNLPLMTQIKTNLAWLGVLKGDYVAACDVLAECIVTFKAEGDLLMHASSLNCIAWAHLGLNEHQAADACFKEALAISRSFMDNPEIIHGLQGLLCVGVASGFDERALRLAGAASRLAGEWSVRSEPWTEMQAEESKRRSRSRLGTRLSEAAWNEGWVLTTEQVVEYALGESESLTVIDEGPLTRREREVAKLVASGLTNRQIGERLFISWRTVEGHLERITNKLRVRSRTEVAMWAVERGLTSGQAVAEPSFTNKKSVRSGAPSAGRSPH